MLVSIRRASSNDLGQLEELFYLCRVRTFVMRSPYTFQMGDYQKSTVEDEVWIAANQSVIIGFTSIYRPDNFIHNLFVHPNYQGMGVGAKLLKIAESNILFPMTLKIAMDNLRVCTFYEKFGWHKKSIHEGGEEPYVVYEKTANLGLP